MKDVLVWSFPILAVMSVLFVSIVVTIIWKSKAIGCRKNLIIRDRAYDDLRRELNHIRELSDRLKVERDAAVRTINSYYHASFHSGNEGVKSWMYELYREYNEKLSSQCVTSIKSVKKRYDQ